MLSRRAATAANSRWYYWAAAVPLTVGFWLLAVAWVALAVFLDSESVGGVGADPVSYAFSVSLAAFGIPVAVLLVVLPFALYRDALAVRAADLGWAPSARTYPAAALVGLGIAVLGGASGLLTVRASTSLAAAAGGLLVGALVAAGVAVSYVGARHRRVGEP